MAFIEPVPCSRARGAAREMFARQQAHYGYVPNYAKLFGERPELMSLWSALLSGIRRHVEPRRFELVTFAAALELRSSYCALAHARVLQRGLLEPQQLSALAAGDHSALPEVDAAVVVLARKLVRESSAVTRDDVQRLLRLGLSEAQIFDVAAVAAARSFFVRLVDGLGAEPDACLAQLEPALRERLVRGRPISSDPLERLPEGCG